MSAPQIGPCTCWLDNHGHDGHCCFRDHYDADANRVTCGHDDAGMQIAGAR